MTGRSEKAIQNEGLIALTGEPESFFYRSNTGQAWQGRRVEVPVGQMVRMKPGMVILEDGRPVRFGVNGLGDVNGAQMGVPVSVEFKTTIGRQSDQQANFARAWRNAGGVYVLARSPEDAVLKVREAVGKRREVMSWFSTNA